MEKEELFDLTTVPIQEFITIDNTSNYEELKKLKNSTPARLGIGRAGARCKTLSLLRFTADQAAARDAVFSETDEDTIRENGMFEIQTKCKDKMEMLLRPDLGRLLGDEAINTLNEKCVKSPKVQIYAGDGLCSPCIKANMKDIMPAIIKGLENDGITTGTPFFVRYCRVNTVRTVSEVLTPEVTCILIGERPGLLTSESMSAYIAYRASHDMLESDYTVVSNISRHGIPPVEAAAHIVDIIKEMLKQKTSGLGLKI